MTPQELPGARLRQCSAARRFLQPPSKNFVMSAICSLRFGRIPGTRACFHLLFGDSYIGIIRIQPSPCVTKSSRLGGNKVALAKRGRQENRIALMAFDITGVGLQLMLAAMAAITVASGIEVAMRARRTSGTVAAPAT